MAENKLDCLGPPRQRFRQRNFNGGMLLYGIMADLSSVGSDHQALCRMQRGMHGGPQCNLEHICAVIVGRRDAQEALISLGPGAPVLDRPTANQQVFGVAFMAEDKQRDGFLCHPAILGSERRSISPIGRAERLLPPLPAATGALL